MARCEARPARAPRKQDRTARQAPLGEAARDLLDRLSKTRSGEWVFPGTASEGHMSEGALYLFWCGVRDQAGIAADARLHDLRHSHASHAIMNGESLHMAGRLLGHRRPGDHQPVCSSRPRNAERGCGAGHDGDRAQAMLIGAGLHPPTPPPLARTAPASTRRRATLGSAISIDPSASTPQVNWGYSTILSAG